LGTRQRLLTKKIKREYEDYLGEDESIYYLDCIDGFMDCGWLYG
jgi:hypothetical protein